MCNVPTIDMTGTGRNIVKLRQNAGFSVKDLQDIFGFATPNAIYKWQKGMAMPTVDNLIILAAIFGVTVDDIIAVNICSTVGIARLFYILYGVRHLRPQRGENWGLTWSELQVIYSM